MAYLTQFPIPALLNPMINKIADEASATLLLICSHKVWVKVTYDWSTALCLCLCLCRPSFHQSKYDISISTSTRRANLSVFLVLLLMLMSTQFSLAYTCACAYAYAYALVKTGFRAKWWLYWRGRWAVSHKPKLICNDNIRAFSREDSSKCRGPSLFLTNRI